MSIPRADLLEPLEDVETSPGKFDLKPAMANELAAQRILRGYFTVPGTLHHRPGWGAGLQRYEGEPATVSNRQQIVNRARRFLGSLPFVEDASVSVSIDDAGGFRVFTRVRINGAELVLPEVTIG